MLLQMRVKDLKAILDRVDGESYIWFLGKAKEVITRSGDNYFKITMFAPCMRDKNSIGDNYHVGNNFHFMVEKEVEMKEN